MSEASITGAPGSPLRETLERLNLEKYRFDLRIGASGEGWIKAASLAEDGAFVAEQMARIRDRCNREQREAAISAIGAYAWNVGGPAIACYVLSRRIPDVSPENLSLRFDGYGFLSGVALHRGRFSVLASDPAADHPDATVLADEQEMLARLRERFEACMEPLVSLVRQQARVGRRTLWGRVADLVSQVFLMVGRDTPDQARCGEEAEAFVKAPGCPLNGRTGFFVVEHGGRREAFMTRGVCCRAHRDPERGYCPTCPVLSQKEREKRARESMAHKN